MAKWLVGCGVTTFAGIDGVYSALSSALIGRAQVPPTLR
jgi:hypothetical protein